MLSRQGREPSPLCPRCCIAVETSDHIYKGSQSQAMANRQSFLYKFLSTLLSAKTPIHVLSTFEYKLSITLDIQFLPSFHVQNEIPSLTKTLLMSAIRHQNIIGWDNFLRGYTSSNWTYVFQQSHTCDADHPSPHWDKILVESCINFLQQIWSDQNTHLHGTSKMEAAQKLCELILGQVTQMYTHPPKLHSRFPKIETVPLHDCLRRSTTNLQQWLARIHH
jgi:hypothetical protein